MSISIEKPVNTKPNNRIPRVLCACGHKQFLWLTVHNGCIKCKVKIPNETFNLSIDLNYRLDYHKKGHLI